MQITWRGQACFLIQAQKPTKEQLRIVIDPYEDSLGLRLPAMEADLVLVTHSHFDHNNAKGVKGAPFIISHPGEYEVQGVFINGISSFHDEQEGKERGFNTIYTIYEEGLKLCHLGDLGQKELTASQLEAIGDVDILFVPVGGVYTVEGKEAAGIVKQIQPKIAIPMHYAIPKIKPKLQGPQDFLKAMGVAPKDPEQKLTLKARDIAGEREDIEVVMLQPL
jgi:L-ascorbate metabolism protein UlaG (beta-lactamase superfamily)